jgi:hypothetical protein
VQLAHRTCNAARFQDLGALSAASVLRVEEYSDGGCPVRDREQLLIAETLIRE